MRKFLFIDYFFPPLARDWRGVSFVNNLPKLDWSPVVVSAAESVSYRKDFSLLTQVPAETEVHRIGHREPIKEWLYAKNWLKLNASFPDDLKTWFQPALQEARDILKKQSIDVMFTASPPYTGALVGLALKREFGIPWVVDLQDPWSGNSFLDLAYSRTQLAPLRSIHQQRIKRAEREIFETADKVVVITNGHKELLRQNYPFADGKVEVIPVGYDETNFQQLEPQVLYPDKLTVVLTGGDYPGFKDITLEFLETARQAGEDLELVCIGHSATAMQELSIPNLTCIMHLPVRRALSFALGADFLLLITLPGAKYNIPTRLFDYLRVGRPILALVPKGGDSAQIVEGAKAGFVLSYEPQEMKERLRAIFKEWRDGKFKSFSPDQDYIRQFERKVLASKLANVFESAMSIAGKKV